MIEFNGSANWSQWSVTTLWPSNLSNSTPSAEIMQPFCTQLLYLTIGQSLVQIWDVLILCPNALFLLYLAVKLRSAINKLSRTNSPMITSYFILVFLAVVISTLRCIISMIIHAATNDNIVDRVMWLVLKFFLFATEISVVSFSLLFGHLDSRRSVQRVLFVTFSVSLTYSITQIYVFVCLLPLTPVRRLFTLPSKRSFYVYCALLALLYAAQSVGSGLLEFHRPSGMCVVDVTSYIYFTGLAPLIYVTFLRVYFSKTQPTGILFSYKSQVDEPEADDVNLPQHAAAGTFIYNISDIGETIADDNRITSSFDSSILAINDTGSETLSSPNPLYRVLDNRPDIAQT